MVRDRRDRLIDRSTITIERDIFDTSMQTTDRRTISPRMTMWFSSTGEDESTELDLYPMSKESERFLREEGSELKKRKKKAYSFRDDGSRENFRQSLFRIPEYSRSWEWLNIRAHWLLFRSSSRIIEVLPRTTSRLWSRTVLLRLRGTLLTVF